MSEKGIQEGPPIWIESILSNEEWKKRLKTYPNTSHLKEKPQFFKSDYEWRWGMGASLPKETIDLFIRRIDDVLKKAGLK